MNVLVIDYGMGNLGSVRRSLEECGASVLISDDPRDAETATRLVLPGVGSFAQGMARLGEAGWIEPIRKATCEAHVPLLGICLGMQLLADKGHEGGEVEGLSLIAGEVVRLVPDSPQTRIPHVGWNELHQTGLNRLLSDVPDGSDFYFVHSYHFLPSDEEHVVAVTPYCGKFVSAVMAGCICGVQFHPEKSSRPGRQVLQNFLAL